MTSTNIVKLNIGGTMFQTTKSTLTKYDGFFKTLLETSVVIEKFGSIFVDRGPKHFRLVLNFMRDGHVALPSSEQYVQDILKEAEYYLLQGLIELCGGSLPASVKTEVSKGVRVIQCYSETHKVRDSSKTLLHIEFDPELSNDFSPRPSNSVLLFVEKHESRYDIFFQPSQEPCCWMDNEFTRWCIPAPRCTNIEEMLLWAEGCMENFPSRD